MNEKGVEILNQKEKNTYEVSLNNLFKGDSLFVFLYRKTEKILTALYLVTNLLSDLEPMKWQIRKRGGEVLSQIMSFHGTREDNELKKVTATLIEVLSLLDVAQTSNLISGMNGMIIKNEFTLIFEALSSGEVKGKLVLPNDFFEVGFIPASTENESAGPSLSFSSSKGHEMSFRNQKDHSKNIKVKNDKNREWKLKDRKETILTVLRKNKEVTIKDITALIKDCSEKTIQRDLLTMVSEGILKKVGERRWSRYLIV